MKSTGLVPGRFGSSGEPGDAREELLRRLEVRVQLCAAQLMKPHEGQACDCRREPDRVAGQSRGGHRCERRRKVHSHKVLVGEQLPISGFIRRAARLRLAYVDQHAFHHLEEHLQDTPTQSIV